MICQFFISYSYNKNKIKNTFFVFLLIPTFFILLIVQARGKSRIACFLAYFLAKAVPYTKRLLHHPYFPRHCHFSLVLSYFSYFVFNVQPTPVPQNFFFFFISNHLQLKAAPAFVETVQPDFQLETFITLKRMS